MTLLAMLRHGETEWSAAKRLQGRTDIPLSRAGRHWMESHSLPQACAAMRVVSSPLARCVQTARCLGLADVQVEPRITEMAWGEWEGQTLAALRAAGGEALQAREDLGMDFQPPGGESPRQVWARVRPWLAELARAGVPSLAVAHRGVMRVVFAAAMGWDLRGKPPVRIDWRCLQLYRLDAEGQPVLQQLNLPLDQRPAPQRTPQAG